MAISTRGWGVPFTLIGPILVLLYLPGVSGAEGAPGEGTEVFSSAFDGDLPRELRLVGGTWEVQDGRLAQTDPGLDDPCKALIVLGDDEAWSTGWEITAKLRLDAWAGTEWARAGVGFCADPESGHGINLVLNRGRLAFVHDYVAWGPSCELSYEPGVWYWMKLRPFFSVEPGDDGSMVSAQVGRYPPNRWGLHDLHGNVAEWTASAYLPYPYREDDPRHGAGDARRTVRGGSWYRRSDLSRSGCRTSYWPWQRVFDVGFRVVSVEE